MLNTQCPIRWILNRRKRNKTGIINAQDPMPHSQLSITKDLDK
ncbi:hypothetical protein COO91_00156 [Nostoc flagelliforme CCNUN1]|uniref:Uncharacterized protein n=1 Tax=Nostoc flagelliforme CCNUN1 TaxID=2038116 RepID=A0A2K8SFX9_9NOSO|nr:hypothetical protein COO91_00156 [Nostoc flagelliforme CCNUN1]